VPWKVALGNHDYDGDYYAQIEFTNSPLNPMGLWECPAKNYMFEKQIRSATILDEHQASFLETSRIDVAFFCLDSNGAQASVCKRHPRMKEDLRDNIRELSEKLADCKAKWKIVFAHHPMYTKVKMHTYLCAVCILFARTIACLYTDR
jgi:hypothetical protein